MPKYNNSYIGVRKDLIKYIPKGDHCILDVGCALGINGKYLLENNYANEVVGIEYDDHMAEEALTYNSNVLCGDLNDSNFRISLLQHNYAFDYMLFGDVLEHLVDPWKVLKELKTMLKPDGLIIISLPNIAHVELFVQIFIKGTWPRNDRGIFDKTHISWFTRKDAFDLASSAQLEVIQYERKLRARDAIGSKFTWKTKVLKWMNKDLVTFQHLMVCKHA